MIISITHKILLIIDSKFSPKNMSLTTGSPTKIIFIIILLFIICALRTHFGYLTIKIPSKFFLALDTGNETSNDTNETNVSANQTQPTRADLRNNVKNIILYEVSWLLPLLGGLNAIKFLIVQFTQILLRDYYTKKIFKKYMKNINFFKVKSDNPDQRLTEDLNDFCKNVSEHLSFVVSKPMTLGLYGVVLAYFLAYFCPIF